MNIIVIDDFYKNPEAVRSLALNAEYKDVSQLNYPGFQSLKSYSSLEVVKTMETILSRKLNIDPQLTTFGKFRIMLKETGSRLKVHLDGHADWTGVLYLSSPEDCKGGTAFYRHKATGLDGPAPTNHLQRLGFHTWEEMEQRLIEADTLNPDAWEETAYVGMKYNRLVLFQGSQLFHCHTESFGTNKENGRMTQNFFFNEV